MKYFTRFIYSLLFFSICQLLAACKTVRTSEKAVSESATASVTDSRRTLYRTIDSLSRQFTLSFDSASIIYLNPESMEFHSAFPSSCERHFETPFDSSSTSSLPSCRPHSRASRASFAPRLRIASRSSLASPIPQVPLALKIYGLHLGASTKEKSASITDLKDSVAVATQSQKLKSAKADKSAPASAPKYILFIIIITIVIYIVHRLRHSNN